MPGGERGIREGGAQMLLGGAQAGDAGGEDGGLGVVGAGERLGGAVERKFAEALAQRGVRLVEDGAGGG